MATPFRLAPVIGEWYTTPDTRFEVVAVDRDDGTIEIQHLDGTVEELDFDDWAGRAATGDIGQARPPEDAHDSMDADEEGSVPLRGARYEAAETLDAGSLDGLDLFE